MSLLFKIMTPVASCDHCLPSPPWATTTTSSGDPVTIVSGRYKGHTGVVDSDVFQRTVGYPDEYARPKSGTRCMTILN